MEIPMKLENSSNIEIEEDVKERVAEKILNKRTIKQYFKHKDAMKKVQYLVKWKNYGNKDNTWEPKKNLSLEMIKEYQKEKKKKIHTIEDCEDIPDYEKKRLANIELQQTMFK